MIFALKKIEVKKDSDPSEDKYKYYLREATSHSSLRHPFIVDYVTHFEEGLYKCILLKFIDCMLRLLIFQAKPCEIRLRKAR